MTHTTDDAVTVAEAIGRAPLALEQAIALDAPVLYASAVRGPAVVLGAAQRAGRVLARETFDATDAGRTQVLRRASSGREVRVGAAGLWFTLALPRVSAVYPDARSDTALNRNLRPFLKGFSKVGPVASYTGRDFIRAHATPFAWAGLEVTRQGAVLIELMVPDGAPYEPLRALDAVREQFGAAAREAPRCDPSPEVTDPWSPAGRGLSAPVERAVPIGVVEGARVGCAGGGEALWLGGDALCARWVFEDVAKGRPKELFASDLPLLGARLDDLFAVAEALS